MLNYNGHDIYLINTLGLWYGLIEKDGTKVYETMGYTNRDFLSHLTKEIVDTLMEAE